LRTAAILARVAAGQAHAATAADIFAAATIGGARALGRDDLGRIAKADFVMVDIIQTAMQPLYDPVRSLVYAAGERTPRELHICSVTLETVVPAVPSLRRSSAQFLQTAVR
jgi:cytosine/adenosine deaminase-related metal-dependent hydrolase